MYTNQGLVRILDHSWTRVWESKDSMAEIPHSRFQHVYAIVRFHTEMRVNVEYWENSVAVVKVMESREQANAEEERLNKLNSHKGYRYSIWTTRLIPADCDGES